MTILLAALAFLAGAGVGAAVTAHHATRQIERLALEIRAIASEHDAR